MLILDIFDNRFPAAIIHAPSASHHYVLSLSPLLPVLVVHLISVTRGIDNVESQTHSVLLNHYDRHDIRYTTTTTTTTTVVGLHLQWDTV